MSAELKRIHHSAGSGNGFERKERKAKTATKEKPVITHTEILCNAIRNIENEIRNQQNYMGGIPECEALLKAYVDERTPKLEALKEMHRIETGTNYD